MELLPCPLCGSDDVELVSDMSPGSFAACRGVNCGALGPSRETDEYSVTAWNRRAPDPALLALARLGAMVISGYLRQNDTAELCLMAGLTEETPAGHAHRFPGIIDAIAALLAPDGAGEVADD